MPKAVRISDICSGHGCFPPRQAIGGSNDVFIEDLQAHRLGDLWAPHTCKSTHDGILVSASEDVFADDKPLGRIGDQISCSSFAMTGAITVEVND